MKIITINLPETYLECLSIICATTDYGSRSEAVRCAIKKFLKKEKQFSKTLNSMKENALENN